MVNVLNKQLTEMTEETSYTTETLGNYPLYALEIYGKSTQGYASCGGTPLGKNLLSLNQNYEISTPQSICSNLPITLQEGTTYTFSYVSSSFISNSSINTTLTYNDGTSGFLSTLNIQQGLNSFDFTCAKPVTKISLYANVSTATTFSNLQIELGSTATSYEPYYSNPNPDCPVPIESVGDDGAVEVTACGKNLLPSAKAETKTLNGVTITSYGDGSYHISGTATGNATSVKFTLPRPITTPDIKPLYVSLNNNSASKNASVAIADPEGNQITYLAFNAVNRKAVSEKWSGVTIATISFYVQNGETVDITCKPQLEINIHTDFESYTGNVAEITTGMPLCSIGDVRDELIYNADGTGKIVKRVKKSLQLLSKYSWAMSANPTRFGFPAGTTGADVSNGYAVALSEHFSDCRVHKSWIDIVTDDFESLDEFKAFLDANEVYVYYPLAEPQEIELSAAEMAELQQLKTLNGVCNIYNSGNGKMYIRAMTAGFEYGHEVGFFDSKI